MIKITRREDIKPDGCYMLPSAHDVIDNSIIAWEMDEEEILETCRWGGEPCICSTCTVGTACRWCQTGEEILNPRWIEEL